MCVRDVDWVAEKSDIFAGGNAFGNFDVAMTANLGVNPSSPLLRKQNVRSRYGRIRGRTITGQSKISSISVWNPSHR